MFYNYAYLDPRKKGNFPYNGICFLYEPIYIGKGKDKRCFTHLNTSKVNNKIFKNKLIFLSKYYNMEEYIVQFNFTEDENIAYYNEKQLIIEIGTIRKIDGLKEGSLTNIAIGNNPPSHKGKTYLEIYGEERSKEQLLKRRELQEKVGGYFKGRKHSEESKKKISEHSKGENNPNYGNKLSEESLNKLREGIKNYHANNISKSCKNIKITSPDGEIHYVNYGLKKFCKEMGLSYGTFQKALKYNRIPICGKAKGWSIEYVN